MLKVNSSRWVHEQFPAHRGFGWQTGYGAFTVSDSRREQVRNDIAAQQTHHRRVSFQVEFLALLNKHGLRYDSADPWQLSSYAPGGAARISELSSACRNA